MPEPIHNKKLFDTAMTVHMLLGVEPILCIACAGRQGARYAKCLHAHCTACAGTGFDQVTREVHDAVVEIVGYKPQWHIYTPQSSDAHHRDAIQYMMYAARQSVAKVRT